MYTKRTCSQLMGAKRFTQMFFEQNAKFPGKTDKKIKKIKIYKTKNYCLEKTFFLGGGSVVENDILIYFCHELIIRKKN